MPSTKMPSSAKERRPGRPPAEHQFRPGQSGNPKGRPRRSRSLVKLIDEELDQQVELTENGKRVKLTKREVLAKKLVNDAITGDRKAQSILLSRMSDGEDQAEQVSEMDPTELARFVARFLPNPEETPE